MNFTGAGHRVGHAGHRRHARLPGRSAGHARGVSRRHRRAALAAPGGQRRGHADHLRDRRPPIRRDRRRPRRRRPDPHHRLRAAGVHARRGPDDSLPPRCPPASSTRTRALVPQLRESAVATEQARRVLPETFDALSRAGVFRMTAPKKYGGDEVDFQTQCDVLAEVARGCPSSSWVATIFSAMSWLAGTYPDEAQEEIFAGGDPRISGVFSPTGTAVRKDGGFVVNGTLGVQHRRPGLELDGAQHHPGGGRRPAALRHRADAPTCDRLDDWNATGMAGTGSHTVVANDVFVPGSSRGAAARSGRGQGRREPAHRGNPYFNLPLARRCSSSTAAARRSAPRAAPTRRSWSGCPGGRSRTRTTPTAPKRR